MSNSSIHDNKLKKAALLSSGALLLVILLLWQLVAADVDELRVTFFDIGQGDSVLIQTPSGHSILIDGGPDRSVLAKLGRALPFYDRSIDVVVLTHPHADHLIGLLEVLQRYDVNYIVHSGVRYAASEYEEWWELIGHEDTVEVVAELGQAFQFDDVAFEILYPLQLVVGEEFDDVNDSSVVTKLTYQNTSFLFTGDAPQSVEEELMQHNKNLDIDVLKVGHHGSRYSSSQAFLQAVSPQHSIIQSEEGNSFDHPHEIVLRRLEGAGSEVLRTDLIGDITILSDGNRVWTTTP